MKLRFKYADQVVGAFILLAIVALALALTLIGLNQRWFAKNYRFRSEFLSGSNISPGTSIIFRGFTIGKIESAKLNAKNTVDVVFYIYDTYYDKVRQFSILELSVSPIGLGSQLLFHQGRSKSLLPEGAFIPRASSALGQTLIKGSLVDIPVKDDTITRLLSNVNPLLENANDAIVNLNRTISDINYAMRGQGTSPIAGILNDAEDAVASLKGVMGTVKEEVPAAMSDVRAVIDGANLAVEDVRGILDQVSALMVKVDAVSDDVKKLTEAVADPTGLVPRLLDPKGSIAHLLDDDDELYGRINGLLDQVDSTLSSVDSMALRLKNEMPGISVMLEEGKATLVKAQDVLEGLKNNPLLKGGIPERKDQEALFRSLRDEEF